MKKIILLTILLTWCLCSTGSVQAGPGITEAEFLRINPEARIVDMGETYAAIDSTANAAFTNPAALANNEQRNISATHIVWLGDVQDETLYYQQPVSDNLVVGAGLIYLHMDTMAARDASGALTGISYRATNTALG
ncbi:MAG: hypothetical protein HY920_06295 [Elusimicrobia bacterium]|nr:hypothetical protein [Elusimicrobiota bacterium]